MKKVFIVLGIVLVLLGGFYFLWSNPELGQNVGNSVTDFFTNLFEGKYVPYNKDFEINTLKVSNCDYYYNKLTEDQQKMYTAVAISVKNLEQMAKVRAYQNNVDDDIVKDAAVAMEAFFADHPEVFYVDLQYEVYTVKSVFGKDIEIKLKYTTEDKDKIKAQVEEISKKIDEILSSVESSKSDIEKEIEIHDKLCDKIKYYEYTDINSIPLDMHSVYGAFVKGEAVCDGMSKSYQILLDRANIENILVVGKIEELHAWNLVKIENKWYNVDITSDKSIKGEDSVTIHSYFNVTDDMIQSTHTFSSKELLPEATGTKYNYYTYKNYFIDSNDNFNDKLQKIISSSKDSNVLEFAVNKNIKDVPDKMISSMQSNKNTEYLTENLTRVSYYNILNSYIIKKIK